MLLLYHHLQRKLSTTSCSLGWVIILVWPYFMLSIHPPSHPSQATISPHRLHRPPILSLTLCKRTLLHSIPPRLLHPSLPHSVLRLTRRRHLLRSVPRRSPRMTTTVRARLASARKLRPPLIRRDRLAHRSVNARRHHQPIQSRRRHHRRRRRRANAN